MDIHQRIDNHLNLHREYLYLVDDTLVLYHWTTKPGGPECHTPEDTGEFVVRRQWISIQGEPWKRRQRNRAFVGQRRHLTKEQFRDWAFE